MGRGVKAAISVSSGQIKKCVRVIEVGYKAVSLTESSRNDKPGAKKP